MDPARRDFLQRSATAAAALTLHPIVNTSAAAADNDIEAPPAETPVHEFERRMLRARPVPLDKVRLTGGPLKHAQDITAQYLLSMDPDRMLAYYRVRAGLPQKAEPLTGWDGGGRNLTGHIAGHHLSAVSLMYQATGDARFKERADYIVREFDEVQRQHGDGFLSGLENLREAFGALSRGEIRSGGFDLNGLWSPWYTLHKTYAGLRDAYRHAGSELALQVEIRYAAWAEGVLAPLTDEQVQKMLLTEFGGMNEVFADLYADTNDGRWLALSRRFEHHAFTGPLKRHQDNLSGKHGNCQIPKLMGSAARFGYTAEPDDIVAASFFWDRVVHHHSYATGGHGLAEYYGPPDELSQRVDGRAAETCNVYNMIKLTRRLFSLRPDAQYVDFQERALFNHILASIDPEDGRTSYMVPVGRGVQQEYQDMQRSFTCCVGSGMESHALHGLGVWSESDDILWLNLLVPSTAECMDGAVRVALDTDFPDGESATLRLTLGQPREFTLAVRRPIWAGDAFTIALNGTDLPQPTLASMHDPVAGGRAGGLGNEAVDGMASPFVEIRRTWSTGDTITLHLPKTLRLEPTKDDPTVTAIMWGPLVLAADHGPRRQGRGQAGDAPAIPMLVSATRAPDEFIAPASRPGDFVAKQVARVPGDTSRAGDVNLAPFYRTHRRTYSVYFDLVTPEGFDARVAAMAAEREAEARLDAATVAAVVPDSESERSANYRSEPADRNVTRNSGRAARSGPGWFSYDLTVDPAASMSVVVTYRNDPGLPPLQAEFEILVDGASVGHYIPDQRAIGFYNARYEIPAQITRGKSQVTVRIDAGIAGRIVPVFGVRTVRKQ
jgi:hypothetical protein